MSKWSRDLQEVSNEVLSGRSAITTDGARVDIAASGFWGGRHERTFLDVRVFNPYAPSNRQTTDKCFRKHEMEKKRAHEQRIRENILFCRLTTGIRQKICSRKLLE